MRGGGGVSLVGGGGGDGGGGVGTGIGCAAAAFLAATRRAYSGSTLYCAPSLRKSVGEYSECHSQGFL